MMKTLLLSGIVVALGLLPAGARAQTNGEKLEILAFAVHMGAVGPAATAIVDIKVDGWSSAEEREQLITTMLENGPEALLKALQKVPAKGRFSVPGKQGPDPQQLRLGHDLRNYRRK